MGSERVSDAKKRPWLLRILGLARVDYGYACGRAWVSVEGVVIAQTTGDDVYATDPDVRKIIARLAP